MSDSCCYIELTVFRDADGTYSFTFGYMTDTPESENGQPFHSETTTGNGVAHPTDEEIIMVVERIVRRIKHNMDCRTQKDF